MGISFFIVLNLRFVRFDARVSELFDALQKIFGIASRSNLHMPFPSRESFAKRMLSPNSTRP
jgi:hypothetical protein